MQGWIGKFPNYLPAGSEEFKILNPDVDRSLRTIAGIWPLGKNQKNKGEETFKIFNSNISLFFE
jgi:hypothetical protein